MDAEEDPFGPEAHDRECPKHSKKHGHYCNEYDGLWICFDCSEMENCLCCELTEVEKKEIEERRLKSFEESEKLYPLLKED